VALIKKAKRIGDYLLEDGIITPAQLNEALRVSRQKGERLGKILVELGFTSEADIAEALARQYGIPFVIMNEVIIEPHVLKQIPESLARRWKVIPISIEEKNLSVAMVDPLDVVAIDELKKATGYNVLPSVTTETELMSAVEQYYGVRGSLEEVIHKAEGTEIGLTKGEEELPETLERIASEAPVVQLVNLLIAQAVRDGASDLHIEPDEDVLRVRMRVDGVLHEVTKLELKLHPAVISRLKIMGDLNIAEKRVPQDGRFVVKVGQRDIDIRLSTLPIIFGEKAALRLLDKGKGILKLEQLTPLTDTLKVLSSMIRRPYGMILLTGPTGSGKTTTAYTLLSILNTIKKNIVTVEDPVEYHIKLINQLQVNPKAGVTFANALRHVLRQDPDIIMIGEIRDKETAEIAIQAALTGHLVISTVHTNTAIGTVSRLLDMGIEPFLISSAIACIAGQRLIRSICKGCKKPFKPTPEFLAKLRIAPAQKQPTLFKGEGCPLCKGTGYKGRFGIFEILIIDKEIRNLMLSKSDANFILGVAVKKGFRPLRQEGMRAVLAGYTTYEELLQATQEVE
jgi:type IV pilus assembly protein PilB